MSQITVTPDDNLRLHKAAVSIRTRQDFVAFARALGEHSRQNPTDWENRDLSSYLEALAAWVEDMDGYFSNQGEPVPDPPSWKTLGQILLAARVYE